ncbi:MULTISPECIES: tape measure protein [unclassified Microbacterium]|uniref:tape measure protein n=1 Tax=unclassified Microbacterium TaxID=2609290 RepID=UPI003868673A
MAEVASASVSLLPTFGGGAKKIEQAMGPALDRAGATGGRQYGDSFAGALMSSPAVKSLVAAGGIGSILFAGIDRVKAIDTAQAKLRGLGNDAARVDTIMGNALASVKGTAFGLGDAVTVAAQLTAAQIPAGAQLEQTLKSVANAAAASGSSLGEMGSIYAKVASLNKAQNDSLQQVADRGLPIYQALADQMGVTADEVFKLASAGKIGFADFAQAMTSASGTVAAEMGTTIQGRVDNMLAAVGRLGAGLAGGALTQGKDVLSELTEAIDGLTPAATALGDGLGGVLSVINAVPGPVKAAAIAAIALSVAMRSNAFNAARVGIAGSAASFRTLRLEAQLAGAAMPGVRVGLASVASTARATGSAMLGAFGGPVGLAIGGVSLALGGLISLWEEGKAAADAQKAAVDTLSGSFDTNTGAVTENTISVLNDQLKETFPLLEQAGVDYRGLTTAIASGDPTGKLAAVRGELQGIIDKQKQERQLSGLSVAKSAVEALRQLDSVSGTLTAAQKSAQQALSATTREAEKVPPVFNSIEDAVNSAFSSMSAAGNEANSIRDLAQSIIDNGTAIDSSTAGGISNLNALQGTIAAMAQAAGDDYGLFTGRLFDLLAVLDAKGVDTQNIMGAVRAAVQNVAGRRWAMFFDGSQPIAEAQRVIAAYRSLVAAAKVANNTGLGLAAGALRGGVVGYLAQYDAAVRAAASSNSYVASTFKGVSKAAGGATKATTAAGSAAKKTAADYAALRAELYATAREWLAPSPFSSEATSLIERINDTYSEKAITKATRDRMLKTVKDRDVAMQKIATERERIAEQIEDANSTLQDAIEARSSFRQSIIDGFRDLGDLTRFAKETEKTVTEMYQQGDRLFTVTKRVSSMSSAEDLIGGLRKQVAEARSFKAAIDDLRKLGLNDTSLQDLLGQFVSTGDASIAKNLAAGGKTAIGEVNELTKQLGDLTGTDKSGWAKDLAQDLFGAGVDAADGFLKGLQSRDKALNQQYKDMAARLLSTIKKDLGIKSPSRKMAELAGYTSDGWNQNLHLDPITPAVSVPGVGETSGASGLGAGEVWLLIDGEPVRAIVEHQMAGAASARMAARRGGRR